MRTYGEDDDEVDWITAGILYVCVKPVDRREYGLPAGQRQATDGRQRRIHRRLQFRRCLDRILP